MSRFEEGRQSGLKGAWDPNGDIAGQLEGQRQREQAQAEWRDRVNNSWRGGGGGGGGGGQDNGMGVVLLLALAGGGVLIFTFRFLLLALAYSILVAAVLVFATRRATGLKDSAWGAARSAALAHAVPAAAMVGVLVVAALLNRVGINLTPGLELFTDGGTIISTGPQSFVLPFLVWVAAGAWWLNREGTGSPAMRAVRWGAALLTMVAAPWLGLQLAGATMAAF